MRPGLIERRLSCRDVTDRLCGDRLFPTAMLPGSDGRVSCFIGIVEERDAALLPLRVLPKGTDDKGVGKVFALAGAGRSSNGCW